mmetsp:Transcript_21681/g.34894  ORF Transcript_21681/g.34894 Transcript_21681/m.34894 type:complete len:80 (-) Transcript_21681:321-560(-)
MAGGTTTIIDCEFWNGECQQDGYEGTIHLYANGGGTLTISGSKFVGGTFSYTGSFFDGIDKQMVKRVSTMMCVVKISFC